MSQYLFVYGTLLPAQTPPELQELTRRLRFVSAGSMPGQLYDLGQYPGAVFDANSSSRVLGQVFELPDDPRLLAQLDEYEGCLPADPRGSLFSRQLLPITLEGGSVKMCWVYLYNRPLGQAPLIPSGDYSAYGQ
jgi:gamma-glutamylcyclotransferase (GGCT)/AIG2-like uncharacterized protein YtfP